MGGFRKIITKLEKRAYCVDNVGFRQSLYRGVTIKLFRVAYVKDKNGYKMIRRDSLLLLFEESRLRIRRTVAPGIQRDETRFVRECNSMRMRINLNRR